LGGRKVSQEDCSRKYFKEQGGIQSKYSKLKRKGREIALEGRGTATFNKKKTSLSKKILRKKIEVEKVRENRGRGRRKRSLEAFKGRPHFTGKQGKRKEGACEQKLGKITPRSWGTY